MHRTQLMAALALAIALAGCTDAAKAPAEAAIQTTEAKVAEVKVEATKYAAAQLKAVEGALATAKEAYAKGDFKGALSAAKELPAKASALAAAVADRKAEESRAFDMATAQLPQFLEALKAQVDGLVAAKKLPKGTTAAAVASAKEELAAITKALEEATAKARAGLVPEATAMAQPLREKASALARRIGALAGTAAK